MEGRILPAVVSQSVWTKHASDNAPAQHATQRADDNHAYSKTASASTASTCGYYTDTLPTGISQSE